MYVYEIDSQYVLAYFHACSVDWEIHSHLAIEEASAVTVIWVVLIFEGITDTRMRQSWSTAGLRHWMREWSHGEEVSLPKPLISSWFHDKPLILDMEFQDLVFTLRDFEFLFDHYLIFFISSILK